MYALMHIEPFIPSRLLRPAMVQTFLAGQKFRKRGENRMRDVATKVVLDLPRGVRLSGEMSKQPNARGTVMLLSGWEGSVNSTYVLCCGRYLFEQGFNVFRLNFRDHGDSHHLNEGLFYGGRFDEVWDAVERVAQDNSDLPLVVIGFSLGGNFALRVARKNKTVPLENLHRIYAISPVINPLEAAYIPDTQPLIKRYFMKKWSTSLAKKVDAFPHLYDLSILDGDKSIIGLTERFLKFTPFDTLEDFFNAYRIWPDDLLGLNVPTQIIMAKDDPVTPASHLSDLNIDAPAEVIELDHGGHNAFFTTLMGPTWYDVHIARQLEDL